MFIETNVCLKGCSIQYIAARVIRSAHWAPAGEGCFAAAWSKLIVELGRLVV
jgi:hypothetical protein